jgi:hypothetical protein
MAINLLIVLVQGQDARFSRNDGLASAIQKRGPDFILTNSVEVEENGLAVRISTKSAKLVDNSLAYQRTAALLVDGSIVGHSEKSCFPMGIVR